MSSNEERKISSLRDLPLDIAPPRDLWQGIEAQITAAPGARDRSSGADSAAARGYKRAARMRMFAAAAVIAALAIGIWIGRAVLPVPGKPVVIPQTASNSTNTNTSEPSAGRMEYVMDARYLRQRAALVKDLETRLASLPPESRAKVLSSLKAINDSKRELEAELGKDPSNALLQELLVNTYQDEMRVLTAVHEAGNTGEGT
jgi:hypothetical protein